MQKAVLPLLINADQTGYQTGLAIFLNFEKSFDSIEWDFLFKALNKLTFCPDFKNSVQTCYCNITSCVTNNGYASDFFQSGARCQTGLPTIRHTLRTWY